MTKAMFAFSGDPIHYGHLNVIERGAARFDEFIVGIGINPDKKYLFSLPERLAMAEKAVSYIPNVCVVSFEGLLVDYAYEQRIPTIVKGVRDGKDFDYEVQLHHVGESQQSGIETFFLPTNPNYTHVSSSIIKALQQENGFTHGYVPLPIKQNLEAKISKQYIIGVTGEIGSGKSYLSNQLVQFGVKNNVPIHNIELDHIGHDILHVLNEPLYLQLRKEIIFTFGETVSLPDGTINRKALGEIVFDDHNKLSKLNELMAKPLQTRLRRELHGKQGLILLNAALLAESDLTSLCNNNVILVTTDKDTQGARLNQRDLNHDQIERRLSSQYTTSEKLQKITEQVQLHHHGKVWAIENSNNSSSNVEQLLQEITNYFQITSKF